MLTKIILPKLLVIFCISIILMATWVAYGSYRGLQNRLDGAITAGSYALALSSMRELVFLTEGMENENIKTSSDPKHLFIYDAAGNCLESLEAIFNKYIKEAEHKDGSSENINHTFAEDMFLTTNHHIIDKIKIKSVNFDLEFISAPQYDPQEIIRNIEKVI